MPQLMPSSILVLGAGELGSEVLKSLASHPLRARHNTPISLLLRPSTLSTSDAAKQREISSYRQDMNITTVPGDLVADDVDALAEIFKPFHTVISCTGMTFPAGTQSKVAKAVLAAGSVRRYFPWQFGVDYDVIGRNSSQNLFTEQLDVRELLRGQEDVEWVIVSTGMFISFLFEPAFGIVVDADDQEGVTEGKVGKVVTAIGGWENSITVTAPQDIGRVVAELVFAVPEARGVVYTAGDTVSMRQVANVVEKVAGAEKGMRIERREKSVQQLKEELAEDPENGMKKYRVVFAEGKGVAWEKEKTVNAQRGLKLMSVEEWAKANLR